MLVATSRVKLGSAAGSLTRNLFWGKTTIVPPIKLHRSTDENRESGQGHLHVMMKF